MTAQFLGIPGKTGTVAGFLKWCKTWKKNTVCVKIFLSRLYRILQLWKQEEAGSLNESAPEWMSLSIHIFFLELSTATVYKQFKKNIY